MREQRAAEQGQAREATLDHQRSRMRELREQRAAEQGQAREVMLGQQRSRMREQRAVEQGQAREVTLDQQWVQSKLATFHAKLACTFHHCSCCNKSFPGLKVSSVSLCSRCSHDTSEPKPYSESNNMDPGPVPPALQELTQVEEMLISPVMPMMSVYRLPHGQLGYSGHVINLPQDVASFVSSLPRHPSSLDLVVIRKESTAGSHKDFAVCTAVVERA